MLPSFVHVGSPIPPCWVVSLLGPCGLGHRLHSLCRWMCTFRPSLYHSILSGFKNGRTGYRMWCPWRAFGSWTPLIRPLWGLAGSLEVSSFFRHPTPLAFTRGSQCSHFPTTYPTVLSENSAVSIMQVTLLYTCRCVFPSGRICLLCLAFRAMWILPDLQGGGRPS